MVEALIGGPPPLDGDAAELREVVDAFANAARASGLDYGSRHDEVVRAFVTALATKPFVILAGLSGSGKTRLAQSFGDWLGAVRVVAVRPDWTSPDALFGFENALSEPVDGRYAWNVPETLEFILQARDSPERPHLLLLDEMNLAHVERYFADALSGMESRSPILPDLVQEDGVYRLRRDSTGKVELPVNLFIVGTVNVDETTYMFSPKVLDRANTFEFRVADTDLVAARPGGSLGTAIGELAAGFLRAAHSTTEPDAHFAGWLREVHRILAAHDREFGHRTFQEALRFAALIREAGEQDPLVALDCQMLQKVLPKLHGSRRELAVLLDELGSFCMHGPASDADARRALGFDCAATADETRQAVLPGSYAKVHRMARKLRDNHFVSFAE